MPTASQIRQLEQKILKLVPGGGKHPCQIDPEGVTFWMGDGSSLRLNIPLNTPSQDLPEVTNHIPTPPM